MGAAAAGKFERRRDNRLPGGDTERTLRHIIDFEAEVAILAEVPNDPRVRMIPYRTHRVVVLSS